MDCIKLAAEMETAVNTAFNEMIHLPEAKAQMKPTSADWSIKEVIGHLVDSASNNHQRWVRLQISDGIDFPEYQSENEKWVSLQKYNEQPWEDLLNLWRSFNLHLASILRNVNPEALENIWVKDEDTVVMLQELMVGYVRHLNMHMEQIQSTLRT